MPRPTRTPPLARTESWPNVPSPDPSGEVARRFALNLRSALGAKSLRAAADVTGVDHSTIQAILQGRVWPDLETIAKLERGFGVVLWPGLVDIDS
ncbi:helix-turn-helix domain-containing protein [Planctomonas deserti]|uniref:helix-turn-helix domain-containing protein n=1 Tax=Planctomonas deserti TaxID=2144185 RepID=UPI000D3813E8